MRTSWVTVPHVTACVGCTKCGKRRAYVSGSGGASMYTSNARRMHVITSIQLDSGLRWMFERYLGLWLGLGLSIVGLIIDCE